MRDRVGVFRVALDFFAADFLAVLAERVDCVEEEDGDCAANQGTNRNSESAPARQRRARRTGKSAGVTTIMFSLYAHFD